MLPCFTFYHSSQGSEALINCGKFSQISRRHWSINQQILVRVKDKRTMHCLRIREFRTEKQQHKKSVTHNWSYPTVRPRKRWLCLCCLPSAPYFTARFPLNDTSTQNAREKTTPFFSGHSHLSGVWDKIWIYKMQPGQSRMHCSKISPVEHLNNEPYLWCAVLHRSNLYPHHIAVFQFFKHHTSHWVFKRIDIQFKIDTVSPFIFLLAKHKSAHFYTVSFCCPTCVQISSHGTFRENKTASTHKKRRNILAQTCANWII